MKLLNCRIIAFGKLKDVQFDFYDGLNSFCFENGWGKTTLAAFIRAMFYGLKSERANSKDIGERTHYRPFDGRQFGGSLQFEMNGDIYTVKRDFDARSEARDRAEFYCNGKPIKITENDFGKSIFSIDEQSFARTLFAGHEDIETGSTGDINARLSDYTKGETKAEDAIKILDAERKKYRKDRGTGGIISAKNAACERIRADIYAAEQHSAKLDGLYAQRAELEKNYAQIEGELHRTEENEQARARRNTYAEYTRDAKRERAAASEIAEHYPNGMPDRQEIETVRQQLADMRATQRSTTAESCALEELKKRFTPPPAREDIELCRKATQSMSGLSNTRKDEEHYKRLHDNRIIASVFSVAVISFVLAITCFFYKSMLLGGILTAISAIVSIGGIFVFKSFKKGNSKSQSDKKLEQRAREIYTAYGYDTAYEFVRDIDRLIAYSDGNVKQSNDQPLNGNIAKFFEHYAPHIQGSAEERLNRIYADFSAVDGHIRMAEQLERRAKEFYDGNAEASSLNTQELVRKLASISSAINSLDGRIEECEAYASKIPDLENSLREENQKVEIAENEYRILVSAMKHIESADRELKERLYLPIEQAYRKYATRINVGLATSATIDAELGVMYSDGGALRDGLHLSSGQAAASALCFRLALCDCIYGNSTPFIVLDDPFAYLDEEHLANCKRVLYELSRDRQIIYFTCHASRRI